MFNVGAVVRGRGLEELSIICNCETSYLLQLPSEIEVHIPAFHGVN